MEQYIIVQIYVYFTDISTMTSITKKQASLALVVVALAAIMIAGTIAASTDSAFAHKKHHKHHSVSNHQSITQKCKNHQRAIVVSSSLTGSATSSNTPVNVCLNANAGNNVADNSSN